MSNPNILAPLHNLYQMQAQLLGSATEGDASSLFHPELASLNWLYGYSVYQELYWLREVLMGDKALSQRIEHLFRPGELSLREQCQRLPPRDHLLNWGREIRDEHLMRLANPNSLPKHPLLEGERLQWFLLQEQAKHYETMLLILYQRSLHSPGEGFQVNSPLTPGQPSWDTKELSQGHFRIGARNRPEAYDNELPPQAVELSSYRIALQPVSNSQYLAFMQADSYNNPQLWSREGWAWQQTANTNHPEYWRQDRKGKWYGIAINGPSELPPEEPVYGINQHEAQAFATWVDSLGGEFSGAILQHEYQWELAARSRVIKQFGRAWEWCSNSFHPYPKFQPFPDPSTSMSDFAAERISLRGGSLHTLPVLRRPSMRHRAPAAQRYQLSGLRLVFPPRYRWA
jgi:iron(II)-dependent oxidoreductase